MAHIEDRWEKVVNGKRERTPRHGKGMRWRARYFDPDGKERSQMFGRRVDAERFLSTVSADVLRGAYVDPSAGRVTFREFATSWLEARTFDEATRIAVELRLRRHAFPGLGDRELRDLRPSAMQAWVRRLQGELAPRYVRVVFANASDFGPEEVTRKLVSTTIEQLPVEPEPWRPGDPPSPELEPVLGRWWSEGTEFIFRFHDGKLEARWAGAPEWADWSIFEPLGADRFRTLQGRERGELLRIARDEQGVPVRLYWATYPFTRVPETFG